MSKTISFLLGAGFSAPMGYPIGNQLNEMLVENRNEPISFHTSGSLVVNKNLNRRYASGYRTSFDASHEFCNDLIQYYKEKKGHFNYEEFYDYIIQEANDDPDITPLAEPYIRGHGNVSQLLYNLIIIFNQLVAYYLKDGQGKKWYDDEPFKTNFFPNYNGFLSCLQTLKTQYDSIEVHTLNHDLFFESLNNTSFIDGEICDGFEELGSEFYAPLNSNGRTYHCRLEKFTGQYKSKIKLYKLHGSRDYGIYYASPNEGYSVPEIYLKTRYGIGFGDLMMEVENSEKGELEYHRCWINYHADFLTGTTYKIRRYPEPLLYKQLFEKFVENLSRSDKLIIIGYGGFDSEINRLILENFDYHKSPVLVLDPYAGDGIKKLIEELNATHLGDTTLDNIDINQICSD